MKWNSLFLSVLLIPFISCNSAQRKNNESVKTDKITDSVNKQKAIDEQMAKGNRSDDEDETPTLAEERERIIQSYDHVKIIDTIIINGSDKLKLHLKYYCLKDSNIAVPKKYQFDEKERHEFMTHPFASNILLIYNQDTVLNRQFKAQDFHPYFKDNFGGNLKKYGSILMPVFSENNQYKDQIVLSYSIAIPATDIGKGMQLIISKNGSYKISEVL